MINELRNIISSASLDCSGSISRWYPGFVPQGTEYPYCSYHLLIENYNGKDSLNLYGDVKVQFSIYDSKDQRDYGTRCNTILQEVLEYFDNEFQSFANTNGSKTVISCIRDFTRPASYNEGWSAYCQFNIKILN